MKILQATISPHLESILSELGVAKDAWESLLQPSREASQGDLTLPCFPFASVLRKAPQAISDEIAGLFPQLEALANVSSVNGYLNFTANPEWLADVVLSNQVHIGSALENSGRTGETVLLEHTSANPNGPFHVGRARNAILGDTLVRLHRLHGDDVRAEYYVDDMGKQVGVLAWALDNLSEEDVNELLSEREPPSERWLTKADHQRVRWYQAAQILRKDADEERKAQIEKEIGLLVHASEHGDVGVLESFEAAYTPVLEGMLATLSRLGISYDTFTKESRFVVDGTVAKLMDSLDALEISGTADNGAGFLDLGRRGLKGKTEFFYRRGDGSSLYATRDVAYHMWKWGESNRLVNVLGEDHKLQAKQVGLTLEELGQKRPEVLFYSFIKLPEGKMSTRQGNVVFMDDLLEEAHAQASAVVRELRPEYDDDKVAQIAEAVGTAAVRFNIIKVSPEKGFTFRWEEALAFEAGSAPFIMYAHTRACSISKRAHAIPTSPIQRPSVDAMPEGLVELLRLICKHNDVLERSVREQKAHLFALHMLELANAYNGFYRDCPVVRENQVDGFAFAISQIARKIMRSGLEGLGITPIEEM
ncbi:MAG TPA: arginine--tRNA ligase [Candidatus Poseidoniaceae archaeon]|nr:MAG TPA: arginine--tRNA ligase [Candidatus Poseidoniales archaeon]HII31381.1 arginine--tRNA ligase [Candidatus Poseidoniaceae archaeon]|tara:strand:- start:3662 stop:5431 length:1770 start_codon:yes stop_codon:yes gene_type:complete